MSICYDDMFTALLVHAYCNTAAIGKIGRKHLRNLASSTTIHC